MQQGTIINSFYKRALFYTLGLFILLPSLVDAQTQPLSRNDKAQIELSTNAFEKEVKSNNPKEASRHLNDMAYLYWEHNDYKKAIEYYERSEILNTK